MTEFKKELVAKYQSGVHVAHLAWLSGKFTSITSSILTEKEIKESDVVKGVNVLFVETENTNNRRC